MSYRQALAERLIQILFKLVRRPHSRQELAREFSVAAKTIHRDLDVLSLEYPIVEEKKAGKSFINSPTVSNSIFRKLKSKNSPFSCSLRNPSPGSASPPLIRSTPRTPIRCSIKSEISLPRPVRAKMEALAGVYGSAAIPAKDFSAHSATIDRLASCAVRTKRVEMRYHGLNSDTLESRTVDPYAVYFDPDGVTLKLVAFDAHKSRLSVFSIDRIVNLKELDEAFVRRPDFQLKDYLAENCFNGIHGAPVTVRLKAVGITARVFAERQFHPSQKIIERKQRRGSSPDRHD